MQEFGLVMEQSLESMADRLAGDMVTNKAMQTANDKFLEPILDQWTKFVQNVSFQTGKRLIYKHIDDIVEHGVLYNTPHSSKMDDLAEFGVDVKRPRLGRHAVKVETMIFTKKLQTERQVHWQIILRPSRHQLKPAHIQLQWAVCFFN